MSRLTKRYSNGDAAIGALSDRVMATAYTGLSFDEMDEITAVIEKLAGYEDAEENGTLVRLPCKVGDTVYVITTSATGKKIIIETKVMRFDVDKPMIFLWTVSGCYNRSNIGKTIFLTHKEAETALKECEAASKGVSYEKL